MPRRKSKRWSQRVTETSHALDLESRVFSKDDPRAVAQSLKRSALRSGRRKGDPYRSAMSMLTFYINRAGKQLSKRRRTILEAAKDELRLLFGREPRKPRPRKPRKADRNARSAAKAPVRPRRRNR